MALCPQCSSPPIAGDLFCRKCGTALTVKCAQPGPSVPPPNPHKDEERDVVECVRCGANVNTLTTVCPNCGSDPHTKAALAQTVKQISSVLAVTLSILLAAICLTLFFYIRSLATVPSVSSVLEGGRSSYLDHGTAVFFELVTISLFGLFLALAIPAVVRTVRSATRPPVVATASNEGVPLVAQRLRDLASLRSQGLVSADEYETKRAEILVNV
jgi:hypothetical protein